MADFMARDMGTDTDSEGFTRSEWDSDLGAIAIRRGILAAGHMAIRDTAISGHTDRGFISIRRRTTTA